MYVISSFDRQVLGYRCLVTGSIFLGVGANLPAPGFTGARITCEAALGQLDSRGIGLEALSPWYESAPLPRSEQPWYVNAVALVRSALPPDALLAALHGIEAAFGRRRDRVNAARTLDLDLLDYDGRISAAGAWPILPHPRMHGRAFVLLPLRDLQPGWRHPLTCCGIDALIDALPQGQELRQQSG